MEYFSVQKCRVYYAALCTSRPSYKHAVTEMEHTGRAKN